MPDRSVDSPGVVMLPLLLGGALAFGLMLHELVPARPMPATAARWAGIVLVAASAFPGRRSEREMQRAGVSPPEPTLAVATDGPLRHGRDPLQRAVTGLSAGLPLPLLVDTLWPLLLLVPLLVAVRGGVIAPGERDLEASVGEPYRAYRARVRRWS